MPRNATSRAKIEGFIEKLTALGYNVKKLKGNPQIYSINGSTVNVRCRSKVRQGADGSRRFFYDVSFDVLPEVDYVAYLMTEPDYFFLIPSDFLRRMSDAMYPSNNNDGVGVFTINWDDEELELRDQTVSLRNYYQSLVDEENYPKL